MKDKAFYSSMSSGSMHEISTDDRIFNAIQQAYYNADMTVNGLNLTILVYKDFADIPAQSIPEETKTSALIILDKEIIKTKYAISFVAKAKKVIYDYLIKQGVTFTKNERETQKESNKKI